MPSKSAGKSHRPKVVVADKIDAHALARLAQEAEVVDVSANPAGLLAALPGAAALIVRGRTQVDGKLLEAAKGLEVVARAGVGVDNIDVLAAHKHSVLVVNAPAAAAVSVAELTMGLIIAAARDLGSHLPSLKAGKWTKGTNGTELAGRTIGFVGYGRIAREVAARARAFQMNPQAYDPYVTATRDGTPLMELDRLLATSDVLCVHSALTEHNRHLIDREALAKLKQGAILINVARGPLVDEEALLDALDTGHLAAAGLDVFEQEPPKNPRLLLHPKIVVTPHIGASTHEAQERAGTTVVEDVLRVLRGESPEFPVLV